MAHRIPQALLSLLLANIIYYPGDGTQNPPGTVEMLLATSFIIQVMAHRIPQALLSQLLANIVYYPGDGTQNPPGTVEPAVS